MHDNKQYDVIFPTNFKGRQTDSTVVYLLTIKNYSIVRCSQ